LVKGIRRPTSDVEDVDEMLIMLAKKYVLPAALVKPSVLGDTVGRTRK
jgi:hypothetical protein